MQLMRAALFLRSRVRAHTALQPPEEAVEGECAGQRRRLLSRWMALLCLAMLLALVLIAPGCVSDASAQTPGITVEMDGTQASLSLMPSIQLMFFLTSLALIPAVLMMATSFTRIIIVLSLLRHAIGVPQLPPGPVLLSLTLFLTMFVMAPVWQQVNEHALQPYLNNTISQEEALERGAEPLRDFMFKQTREKDLALFVQMADMERPKNPDDIPTHVLIPAFAISELKTAFQMGAIIFLPFLIIDIVIASVLMSMGMMMMPPIMISLPFKLLLFVLVDGWHLIVGSLLTSFTLM